MTTLFYWLWTQMDEMVKISLFLFAFYPPASHLMRGGQACCLSVLIKCTGSGCWVSSGWGLVATLGVGAAWAVCHLSCVRTRTVVI